jgi:hypothetical protein
MGMLILGAMVGEGGGEAEEHEDGCELIFVGERSFDHIILYRGYHIGSFPRNACQDIIRLRERSQMPSV